MDRRALFARAAAAALLAATGVSPRRARNAGGRLRMALSGAARSDTWVQGDGLFMQVARQGLVFDTLTEVAADGTLRGELATGWQAAPMRGSGCLICARMCCFTMASVDRADVAASLRRLDGVTYRRPGRIGDQIDWMRNADLALTAVGPGFVIRRRMQPMAGIGTGLYRCNVSRRVSSFWRAGGRPLQGRAGRMV